RLALRDELERGKDVYLNNGLSTISPTDHNGYDERSAFVIRWTGEIPLDIAAVALDHVFQAPAQRSGGHHDRAKFPAIDQQPGWADPPLRLRPVLDRILRGSVSGT